MCYCIFTGWLFCACVKICWTQTTTSLAACFRADEICSSWNQTLLSVAQVTSLSNTGIWDVLVFSPQTSSHVQADTLDTPLRFGSTEEPDKAAMIWSLFLAWNLSLWQDHRKQRKGLVFVPLAGTNGMTAGAPRAAAAALPLLERELPVGLRCPEARASRKRVKFRLVVILFCIPKLNYCSPSLLDGFIYQNVKLHKLIWIIRKYRTWYIITGLVRRSVLGCARTNPLNKAINKINQWLWFSLQNSSTCSPEVHARTMPRHFWGHL